MLPISLLSQTAFDGNYYMQALLNKDVCTCVCMCARARMRAQCWAEFYLKCYLRNTIIFCYISTCTRYISFTIYPHVGMPVPLYMKCNWPPEPINSFTLIKLNVTCATTCSKSSDCKIRADSHYTSRFRSVMERHRSVKFSHV
jgi:hypothetical protein